MDLSCKNSIKNIDFPQNYIPVFVPSSDKKAITNLINNQEINIAWLGRLDKDKINSLLNILDNFNKYKTIKKKIIHIIGSGTEEFLIKPDNYKSLEIKLLGRKTNEELDNYIVNKIDILFGMGASLLEAAKLNVPSVLVKISDTQFYDDEYILLSNLKEYILGYINNEDVADSKINTMKDLLDDIYIHRKKEEYQKMCYEHYKKHHSIEYSSFCLMQSLSQTKYTYGRFWGLYIKEKFNK